MNLSWPCQSPSQHDVRIFAEPLEYDMNRPIPHSAPPPSKACDQARRLESGQKLQQIQDFNQFIGDVVAVSGWRNLSSPRILTPQYLTCTEFKVKTEESRIKLDNGDSDLIGIRERYGLL